MSRNTVPIVAAALGLMIVLAVLTGTGRLETASAVLAPAAIAAGLGVVLFTRRAQSVRARPAPVRVRASDRRPR